MSQKSEGTAQPFVVSNALRRIGRKIISMRRALSIAAMVFGGKHQFGVIRQSEY
jgi:hypothetical protein